MSPQEALWIEHRPGWPVSVIFAYNSDARQLRTFRGWLTKNEDFKSLWGLAACLDQGVVSFNGGKSKILMFPVLDENGDILAAHGGDDGFWAYNARTYPVTKVDGHTIGVDQSRLMMCFLVVLHEYLCKRHINPAISLLDAYLDKHIRPVILTDENEASPETGNDQS